jgi:ubiquitin carboxyl-terminal hydrolase 22/27/51
VRWISSLQRSVFPSLAFLALTSVKIFSDESTAYGPINFLVTTWRKSAELAGYQQQDAHEFFISTLNHIHSTSRGSTNVSCNCIIHSTFAGQLQSDVVCERCGNVTSTVDPMLDISLELRGKAGEVMSGENTLTGCLKRQVVSKFISSYAP